MNQLAPMQISPMSTPHIILQIFIQLQALQAENNIIWKHCNATIADLNKQTHKCQRERKRWREMEQELLDEKNDLQVKFLSALEKNTELENFLQQQKGHTTLVSTETKNLQDSLQKVQKELENTLEELNECKDIAINKEEEARKSSIHVQEIMQELNAGRDKSELCNILADTVLELDNGHSLTTITANNTVLKLWQATETVKKLKNIKSEMNNTTKELEAIVNEGKQLKKVLEERENTLSRITDEKTLMSNEIKTKQNQISSLAEEIQQLQHQLREEQVKNSNIQKMLAEQKENCSNFREIQDILQGHTLNEALLDAATRNNVREMEVLLNAGANIEATDDKKRTPLILAAMKGHIEACKFLLKKGANLEARATGWYNNTPFLAAVIYSENLPAVKFLADAGADMYAKDSIGYNAFQKDAINEGIKQWLKTKGKP